MGLDIGFEKESEGWRGVVGVGSESQECAEKRMDIQYGDMKWIGCLLL
jgi:hypothetical protein